VVPAVRARVRTTSLASTGPANPRVVIAPPSRVRWVSKARNGGHPGNTSGTTGASAEAIQRLRLRTRANSGSNPGVRAWERSVAMSGTASTTARAPSGFVVTSPTKSGHSSATNATGPFVRSNSPRSDAGTLASTAALVTDPPRSGGDIVGIVPHPGPDSAASITAAAETVATSPIFDHEWVSAQTGHAHADRLAAARDYVSRAATEDLSPHPLFEPTWVYPGGRWRDKAPDPLSFYLSRPERTRGTHPLLGTISAQWWESLTDQTELPWRFGDKVTLADVRHAVAHGRPVDAPDVSLVLPHRDFARLLPWLRQAYRISATVEILVMTDDPVLARLARGTGAAIPGVRIVDSLAAASAAITVLV